MAIALEETKGGVLVGVGATVEIMEDVETATVAIDDTIVAVGAIHMAVSIAVNNIAVVATVVAVAVDQGGSKAALGVTIKDVSVKFEYLEEISWDKIGKDITETATMLSTAAPDGMQQRSFPKISFSRIFTVVMPL